MLAFGIGIGSLVVVDDFPWYGDLIVLAFGLGLVGGGVGVFVALSGETRRSDDD